jgi:hypothetical protein
MEINIFDDPSQVPQPKDKIKIEEVIITPYPDGTRVFLELRVTAFQERPNLLIYIRDAKGQIVDELSVIATMHAKMEFTRHMRHKPTEGDYLLDVELFYETRQPPQDHKSYPFTIQKAE